MVITVHADRYALGHASTVDTGPPPAAASWYGHYLNGCGADGSASGHRVVSTVATTGSSSWSSSPKRMVGESGGNRGQQRHDRIEANLKPAIGKRKSSPWWRSIWCLWIFGHWTMCCVSQPPPASHRRSALNPRSLESRLRGSGMR